MAAPPHSAERADDLVDAARDLRELADGLLALERARAASPAAFTTVDAGELVQSIGDRMHGRCAGLGITLDVSTAQGCLIMADRLLFEQAIINLVMNALSHGGPDLTRIEIDCTRRRDLLIVVRDNGLGIRDEDADKALSRFGQVTPNSGSGLGLPIANEAIASFGGTLTLGTQSGWFEVRLVLPVAPENTGAPSAV